MANARSPYRPPARFRPDRGQRVAIDTTLPSNTNAAAIMIGEKASDLIMADA
jgi:hypothetical protein